jgi:hypothetical protein
MMWARSAGCKPFLAGFHRDPLHSRANELRQRFRGRQRHPQEPWTVRRRRCLRRSRADNPWLPAAPAHRHWLFLEAGGTIQTVLVEVFAVNLDFGIAHLAHERNRSLRVKDRLKTLPRLGVRDSEVPQQVNVGGGRPTPPGTSSALADGQAGKLVPTIRRCSLSRVPGRCKSRFRVIANLLQGHCRVIAGPCTPRGVS